MMKFLNTNRTMLLVLAIACFPFTSVLPQTMAQSVRPRTSIATSGEELLQSSEWAFRYDLFQGLIEKQGLLVSKFINDAVASPDDSLIVILGDVQKITPATWTNVRSFYLRGGNVLIATDRTTRASAFGILDAGSVQAGPVTTDDRNLKYEGFDDCIRIELAPQASSILEGVNELTTNRSGWLTPSLSNRSKPGTWKPIATLPARVLPIEASRQSLAVLMCDEKSNTGKMLLVADASLFSNGMLWHTDNGLFALRATEELIATNRKRMIIYVDGVPLPSTAEMARKQADNKAPPPNTRKQTPVEVRWNWQNLLQYANTAIRKIAESNMVNETLKNQPRNLDPKLYYRWIWGMIGAGLLFGALLLVFRRSTVLAPFLPRRPMRSWHTIQAQSHHPLDQNSFAAECLARDFARNWTSKEQAAEWQAYLQDFEMQPDVARLGRNEQMDVKSLLELAVFGKKSLFTDLQLVELAARVERLQAVAKRNAVASQP